MKLSLRRPRRASGWQGVARRIIAAQKKRAPKSMLSFIGAVLIGTPPSCPTGVEVDIFSAEGKQWRACEDLGTPGGAMLLISDGDVESVWLPKSYEPYSPLPDNEYYLGLGKQTVLGAKWDMLGDAIIHSCTDKTPTTGLCEPSWSRVEKAMPVMRYSRGNKQASGNQFMCSPYSPESGVRTFTGSRSASVDATFSDHADDCTDNGFPRPQGYVMNLTAIAAGEPPIHDFHKYVNFSGIAEGLVGGGSGYPNLIFYFPIQTQNFTGFGGSRYWTMIASPVPDMEGGREQSVWFRFQQLKCDAAGKACSLHGKPQYYDTYWSSFSPITSRWIRPELQANATGFYSNLLAVKRYWDGALQAEGMMQLRLPPSAASNGTWLQQQSIFAMVRSMISRDDTWHPRYGVLPGYGTRGAVQRARLAHSYCALLPRALCSTGRRCVAPGRLPGYLHLYRHRGSRVGYGAVRDGRHRQLASLLHAIQRHDHLSR